MISYYKKTKKPETQKATSSKKQQTAHYQHLTKFKNKHRKKHLIP